MMSASENMAETDKSPVKYSSNNHIAIITQMYGGVRRKVFPYCIANTTIMLVIIWCGNSKDFHISISDRGHVFMSVMVSYLIVTRSNISLNRYMQARQLLSDTIRIFRELIQHTTAFTRHNTNNNDAKWRMDIASGACSLLRSMVTLLENKTTREDVLRDMLLDTELVKKEKHEKSPLVLTLSLRTKIASHCQDLTKPLTVPEELLLLSLTSDFVTAYHGLTKLLNTPFPFPIVQMTRTVLFVWVFTLPLVLTAYIERLIPLLFVNFVCTYGFIGLELISIEIEDPFGTDPNSFPVNSLAEVAIRDIAVMLQDVDGSRAMFVMRKHLNRILEYEIEQAAMDYDEDSRGDKIKISSQRKPCYDHESSPLKLHSVQHTMGLQPFVETDYGTVPRSDTSSDSTNYLDCDYDIKQISTPSHSTISFDCNDSDVSYDSEPTVDVRNSTVSGKLNDHDNCPLVKLGSVCYAYGAREKENV